MLSCINHIVEGTLIAWVSLRVQPFTMVFVLPSDFLLRISFSITIIFTYFASFKCR
jgi:hypothetical protein